MKCLITGKAANQDFSEKIGRIEKLFVHAYRDKHEVYDIHINLRYDDVKVFYRCRKGQSDLRHYNKSVDKPPVSLSNLRDVMGDMKAVLLFNKSSELNMKGLFYADGNSMPYKGVFSRTTDGSHLVIRLYV